MARPTGAPLGGLLIVLSAFAHAAGPLTSIKLENLLDVEVEGPSRFAQPLSEAPAAVSVITAEDIRRFGFRNLGEALESVRGVNVSYERDYHYIGIRGMARPGDYNTRMLLMTDGIRRNDPLYDTAMVGNESPVDIAWVKRLEFVPGSASSIYGANAVMGVANAVLWSGRDLEGSRVTAEVGTGNAMRLGLVSGQGLDGGGEWMVGFSAFDREGENLHFDERDATAHHRDGERYAKAIAKLSAGGWQLNAGFSTRRKDIPTAFWDTAFDTAGTYYDDQYIYADLSHSGTLTADLQQTVRVNAARYEFRGQYVYATAPMNRDVGGAQWGGLEYLLAYTGLRDHKLVFGAETQRRHRIEQRYFDVSPETVYLDDRHGSRSTGVFVNDEWRLDSRWLMSLGLRSDRASGFAATSPRAALIFRPVAHAAVKLIYSKAFRPPNDYERHYDDGGSTQQANPDLKPEHITTRELAADYVFSPALRVSGSLYRYTITDLIDQTTDAAGLSRFVNREPVRGQGIELEAEAHLAGDLRLKGSLASQTLQQPFGAAPNSPHRSAKLFLDGPLARGWSIGLGVQAMTRRHSFNGEVPGHVVGNLVFRRGTAATGEWRLAVYNFSDHRYLDPASSAVARGAVVQDGRQLRLTWEQAY